MTKTTSPPIIILLILFALVLIGTLLSLPPQRNEQTGSHSPAPISQTSQATLSSQNLPKSALNRPLAYSAASPSKGVGIQPKQKRTAQQENYLKQRLRRDEASLTRERLADGTELIHLNRSQAHFSAATIDDNGSIEVNCHSNLSDLDSQGSSLPSPSTSKPIIR